MPGLGRQHSATNGCFLEVKNQRPLFGEELEEMSVASRPVVAVEFLGKLSFKVKKTRLCGFAQVGLSIVLETRSIDLLEAEALALHAQLKKLSLFSSRGLV